MKILLLMPCDEQHVYAATYIYKSLPAEIRERTFAMPMFMQYIVTVRKLSNWVEAFFDSFLGMKAVYKTAEKFGDDLIVIGNAPADFKFDAVFNFQEIDEALPYKDDFLEKIRMICADEPVLLRTIAALHEAHESQMALMDCTATADFLTAYLQTDPHLDDIKRRYEDRLHFKIGGDADVRS